MIFVMFWLLGFLVRIIVDELLKECWLVVRNFVMFWF